MKFQTLDPRLARLLLEGQEDMLTERAEKRRNAIEGAPCPRCYGKLQEVLNDKHPFTDGEILPRILGQCQNCGYTYDPNTGIVVHTGDPREAQMPDPFKIDHGSEGSWVGPIDEDIVR